MRIDLRGPLALLLTAVLAACGGGGNGGGGYDPLATARAKGLRKLNPDANVPPQCYTKTDGLSNPCWACHTSPNGINYADDHRLQESYAFTDEGQTNHWTNLFVDRSARIAAISDDAALAYVRQDNYTPLRVAVADRTEYKGWKPDFDLMRGFDAAGFAIDGSWWRAYRYKPFLGTFWPTNGSTDDVIIRLPPAFYTDADGKPSREIYKINLAILEAAMAVPDTTGATAIVRAVEPVSEDLAKLDLNGDGHIGGSVTVIRGLPAHYVTYDAGGKATDVPVMRWQYPLGTEFLHTVRYLDPDAPNLMSTRLKEVRYMVKQRLLSDDEVRSLYAAEAREDAKGVRPAFGGNALRGLHNNFGWQLNAFIEDGLGRLRVQTYEEHHFCMGCHTSLGVTVDQTFSFARKPPGAAGWGHQALAGQQDTAQAGQPGPEILTYLRRVGAGDEFRANTEMLARFFPGGVLDEATVRRAAPGGPDDLTQLLVPSRARALALDKAYMTLVADQTFEKGRDAVITPPANVHTFIEKDSDTGLKAGVGTFSDGRLWLQWPTP
ncbi:MAG: hypothetical protein E6R07_01840 [Nevskiaceae bacterium]|nr:MAG: hypothetical protein E6R07_01840 [Nevskiaceae bacterium]